MVVSRGHSGTIRDRVRARTFDTGASNQYEIPVYGNSQVPITDEDVHLLLNKIGVEKIKLSPCGSRYICKWMAEFAVSHDKEKLVSQTVA